MSITESIEYFPLFDAETGSDTPGSSAAIGSGIAVMGSPDALGGAGAIVLYLYSAEQNAWGYVGVMTGAKIAGSEQVRALGSSCVAFGDTVIVGAKGDASTPGRVFVFRPAYGAWTYTAIPVVAELARRDPAKGDLFGAAVAHCFDGTSHYLAVGAPGATPPAGASGSGQVYIFRGLEASNAPWSKSPIGNPNPAGSAADQFGASVAINPSGDGTLTLAAGAPGANEGVGAVYVGRTTEEGTWTAPFQFQEPLVPTYPDAAEDFKTSGFGSSVALTGGVTLAVGAPNDPNSAEKIDGTGAVWIYTYSDGSFVANGVDSSLYGLAEGNKFGASVAFPETSPSEGSNELSQAPHLLVGAPGASSAFRYLNDSNGKKFTQDVVLARIMGQPVDGFGGSVAVSIYQNGAWYLVGGSGNPKGGQDGGGYLYVDGEPAPTWMETPELPASSPLRWGGLNPDWWKKFTPQIPKYLR